jgi:hypothetical protein
MTKNERFELIAQFASRRTVPGFTPSVIEVQESVEIETAHKLNDDSIVESEYNTEPSAELVERLGHRAFDANKHANPDKDLLSQSERREVAQDLWARASDTFWRAQHPATQWLAPIDLFANHAARLTA